MQSVERTNPEGVDYGWVMQVTFVVTIVVGAPLVAVLSLEASLPTWGARAAFAIRVGAVVWFVTAVGTFLYARRLAASADERSADAEAEAEAETEDVTADD